MTDAPAAVQRAAHALTPYQIRWMRDPSILKLLVKARRVGGTYMVTLDAAWKAAGYNLATGVFDPKLGQAVNFVSASDKQSKEMIKQCEDHLRQLEELPADLDQALALARKHKLPLTAEVLLALAGELRRGRPNAGHIIATRKKKVETGGLIAAISAERIQLTNRVEITAFAANPRTIRGFKGHVILDEFGAMPFSQRIWEAASPLADENLGNREGYTLQVIGTPLGDDNMFYQLAKTSAGATFSRHRLTIYEAKAQGFPVDIEARRARCGLEEIFQQEYCCAFLSAQSQYLPAELIDRSVYSKTEEVLTMLRGQWTATAGLDVATAAHGDPCALVRNYRIGDTYWCSPDVTAARGVSFPTQEAWVRAELEAGCHRVAVDRSGIGREMADRLAQDHRVLAVDFTNASKAEMATRCKRLFEQGKQRIPADQDLRRDLVNLRRLINPSTAIVYDVTRDKSGHGDRAWALMLSQHAAEFGPPPFTPRAMWRPA